MDRTVSFFPPSRYCFAPFFRSDPSQCDSNSKDFWFNMQALTSYLRKASDQNPSASYYNVDILKYQVSPARRLIHRNVCTSGMVSEKRVYLQTPDEEEGEVGVSAGKIFFKAKELHLIEPSGFHSSLNLTASDLWLSLGVV